jgi:hypothetical protein
VVASTIHDASELPLRFVALGGSLVSDLGNPVATSARAILAALAAAGHVVTFLEQRNSPALVSLLRSRGSAAFRAFAARYPRIQHRTYELARGWERTVWFGREIGTADAVIALPGTPEPLIPEIAENESPRLVRLIDESFGAFPRAITLVRAGSPGLAFGPAVLPLASSHGERNARPAIVAYDDADAAAEAADRLAAESPIRIVTGTAPLPDWQYVPEVDLPETYRRHERVLVAGAGADAGSLARFLLPLAAEATLLAAPPPLAASGGAVPDDYAAGRQARALIAAVRAVLP